MANLNLIKKKVLVIGSFDSLDCSTVKFLEEAAKKGDLYVCVDNHNTDKLYVIQSIKYVYNARLSSDNFESIINDIQPDIFFDDNYDENKKNIVTKKNIEYVLSIPKQNNNSNTDMDEKNGGTTEKNINSIIADKDKQITKLQKSNSALGKLCNALKALSDSNKTTNDVLRKQNIKLQKDLINAFAAVGFMKEKLDERENVNEEKEQEEEENALESCSLCFGDIENSDLIVVDACKHKYHNHCIYQSIQADVAIYVRMPVCGVCDADGNEVNIPNDMTIAIIQKENDPDFMAQYQKLVAENTN